MSGEYYSIDPTDKVITLGDIVMTGFPDGKHLTAELDDDDYSFVSGNDGVTTSIRIRKDTAEVVVTLQQSSSTNTRLAQHRQIDLATRRAAAPFIIKDSNGDTLIAAKKARIIKAPKLDESNTVENREWRIKLIGIRDTFFVGGNFEA